MTNTHTYAYDAVDNQTRRQYTNAIGVPFTDTLTYNGENHLTQISFGESIIPSAQYVYDGDGNRIKATLNGQTTLYIGAQMEYRVNTGTLVKYYYAGSQRVAMHEGSSAPYFFLNDHLGTTSLTLNSSGAKVAELRYDVWGKTIYADSTTPTRHQFTGQLWGGNVALGIETVSLAGAG